MHLQKCIVIGLVALLVGAGAVYAGLTGVIAGKTTDVDGNPIPGVTISVTGENLPGARVDTTSANGMYRMPQLPPGIYMLRAELMGMKTIERTMIKVSVNSTTKIDLQMEMTPFKETVVVVGESPVLDVKSTTVKSTIERDVTERLPGSDSLFAAFSMSGGITGGGNVRVHGGAFTDNLYLFDGVDTTDPVTSTFGANLNADAIQEVEVQTGGFTAEYGRSMGGIVNAVTKSGGNDFHVIARVKFVDSSWVDDYDRDVYLEEYDYFDPTITVDGPILKDKLWFMVSYNYLDRSETSQTIGFYGADPDNPADLVNIDTSREFTLPYAKLTFQASQAHKFVVNYSGEDATISNRSGDTRTDTPEALNTQVQGGPFYSLEWTWLYNSNLFFVTRVGASLSILDNTPTITSDAPPFFDTYERQNYNNSDSYTEEDRDRFQVSFVGSYFIEDMAGSHEFKSGIEMHDFERDQFAKFPGGAKYVIDNDPDDPDAWKDATRTVYMHEGHTVESGDYIGFFVQDNWSITDSVTINAGLRYEQSVYQNDTGESEVPAWTWGEFSADSYRNSDGSFKNYHDMKFDDMLAPRLGVNWDIFGDGKKVIHAFYGRFYNPFDLSLPGMFQPFESDNSANYDQDYDGPEWHDADRDGIPDEGYFFDDDSWGPRYNESEAGDWNLIDPNIEAEYTDEIMVSYEQEIMENFSIGLTYTHRETNDMIEDTGIFVDEDGNIVWTYLGKVSDDFTGLEPGWDFDPRPGKDYDKHLYYVTNAEGSTREYNGIEINAKARLEHYDLQASYTLSKAEASVPEYHEGHEGTVGQFSGLYDTPATSTNLYGEAPWSCRHYIKIAGSTHWDLTDWNEISFGVNGFYRSGYHYSKRSSPPKTYDPDNPDNVFGDPSTYTHKPPYAGHAWHFSEGRGTYVLPGVAVWDVSLQDTFKFGKWGALTVIVDVENVLDNQCIIRETDTFNPNKPEQFGQANAWASPRTYVLSLKYAF